MRGIFVFWLDDDGRLLACEISGFCRGVDKVVALLSYYAAYVGGCLPSFEPWPSEQCTGILPTFATCVAYMAVMIHTVGWWVMTQRNETVAERHNLDVRVTNAANCTAAFCSHQTVTVRFEMPLRWTSGFQGYGWVMWRAVGNFSAYQRNVLRRWRQ
jgi:hypothetical protein